VIVGRMNIFSADGRETKRISRMSVTNSEEHLLLVFGFVGSTARIVADVRDAIVIG
jgi:hypothetical protein